MIKKTFLFLTLFIAAVSCDSADGENINESIDTRILNEVSFPQFELHKTFQEEFQNRLFIDMATRVLRKPDAATWETKFDAEFRPYFENKASDLEWIYAVEKGDTVFFYLIRDGRDQRGKSNRGVGGKMVLNASNDIQYFEEIFVTKIIDRVNLESIGSRFMKTIDQGESTEEFIQNPNSAIEWPDGRLFYSVQKSEWRYVE